MTHPDDTHPRMRTHKGNIPSLPQTKCCTLCPAKFTRTTHLNRHLRSHTNERLHRCDLCQTAEFTRSDLLTRHKRSCGQSVNRSRRKSCEACAESKIKCNLQYPCAKCVSRGRECIFQNDPEESRNTSKTASSSSSSRTSPHPSSETRPAPSALPPLSLSLTVPDLTSPDSPNWSSHPDFDLTFGVGAVQDGHFVSTGLMGVPMEMDANGGGEVYHPHPHEPAMALDSLGTGLPDLDRAEMAGLDLLSSMSMVPPPAADNLRARAMGMPSPYISLLTPAFDDLDMGCLSAAPSQPLDTYLTLFFTRFLTQVPLIHIPTWKMENAPPLLVRVFHACGALFIKTPEAGTFVTDTFASVTAEIAVTLGETGESSAVAEEAEGRLHLILALVLLQMICLFKRESDGFAPNESHHMLLVSMIRKKDLVQRIGRWTAPELKTPALLEVAWVEWAKFATIQRAVLLAYFHDCCHVMYSAAPPLFSSSELDGVFLPCDEALWGAASAPEWYAVIYTPTPYAMGVARIYGVRMGVALNALYSEPGVDDDLDSQGQGQPQSQSPDCPPLPPFALFLLIHTVLKNISVAQREVAESGASGEDIDVVRAHREFMSRTQCVLDNWLRMWLASPDAEGAGAGEPPGAAAALSAPGVHLEGGVGKEKEPPFVCNPLPFYSLAQVSLWDTFGGE